MCVFNVSETEILDDDLSAYKIVCKTPLNKNGEFFSRHLPFSRKVQDSYPNSGKDLLYALEEITKSDFENTPGIYCFSEINLNSSNLNNDEILLEVKIPKGTKIRRANSNQFFTSYFDIILAEKVIPIKIVKESTSSSY